MRQIRFWILAGFLLLQSPSLGLFSRLNALPPPLQNRPAQVQANVPEKTLCVNPAGTAGCYNTIAKAIAAANPGDTIQVASGTYLEAKLSLPPNVRLQGAGLDMTLIDGQSKGPVLYAGPGTHIENLTILGGGPGYYDAAIQVSQGQVEIDHVRLTANAAGLWALCFDPDTCAVQVSMEGSVIDQNDYAGVNSNEYPVILLRNNTIVSNSDSGIVLNNALSLAENNLVAFNLSGGIVNSAGATLRFNNVYGNNADYIGSGPGEGNFSADPLFKNVENGDYRLRAGSPAIAAGTPSGTDLGAFPFTPAGTPPEGLAVEMLSCSQWKVTINGSSAGAGTILYSGPPSRQTTMVRDLGSATTITLDGMGEAGGGFLAASQYGVTGQESAITRYLGPQNPCPSPPAGLQAGAFPSREVRLQWQDLSIFEETIQVERSTGPSGAEPYQLIASLPANTQEFIDRPPVVGQTYWYRVRAVNATGASSDSSPSFTASFETTPNLDERYLLALINIARADPGAFGFTSRSPVPPLGNHPLLAYAARAQSQAILNSNFSFGQIDPLGRGPTDRARAVGFTGTVSESLVQGLDGFQWVEKTLQTFLEKEADRNKLLCDCYNLAGIGHSYEPAGAGASSGRGQYTVDLSLLEDAPIPSLPTGIVLPYSGVTGTQFTYFANYYNPQGDAPLQAQVVIDGQAYPMELVYGSPSNGTYKFSIQLGVGLHSYSFYFTFPAGQARLPETGTFTGPDIFGVYLPVLNTGK